MSADELPDLSFFLGLVFPDQSPKHVNRSL